jgi:hypothetical protein
MSWEMRRRTSLRGFGRVEVVMSWQMVVCTTGDGLSSKSKAEGKAEMCCLPSDGYVPLLEGKMCLAVFMLREGHLFPGQAISLYSRALKQLAHHPRARLEEDQKKIICSNR